MTDSSADLDQAREWLLELRENVSREIAFNIRFNVTGNTVSLRARECVRKLTMPEFTRLQKVATHFVIEPTNAQSGFNFGVEFYDHPEKNGMKPTFLFFISGEYLPDGMNDRFEGAWEALSPLSHNPVNKRWLNFYGFSELREKSFYDY